MLIAPDCSHNVARDREYMTALQISHYSLCKFFVTLFMGLAQLNMSWSAGELETVFIFGKQNTSSYTNGQVCIHGL